MRHCVVCAEGPSAVGKTTLVTALARAAGAAAVPELDARGAPSVAEAPAASAAWFVEAHAASWRRARALAADAPFAVLDGDPFKGLWYGPTFPDAGWPGLDVVGPLHEAAIASGALAFPDLYVALDATEARLRARRAGDATRTRRGFEEHLRLVDPLRRWFAALAVVAPGRVLRVDTTDRDPDALVDVVLARVASLPPDPPDAPQLLARMLTWAREAAARDAAARDA